MFGNMISPSLLPDWNRPACREQFAIQTLYRNRSIVEANIDLLQDEPIFDLKRVRNGYATKFVTSRLIPKAPDVESAASIK